MIPVSYHLRSLAVRRSTTLAASLGVALVTLVLASSLMLAEGAERTLSARGRDHVAVVLRKGSHSELESVVDEGAARLALSAAPGALASASEIVTVLALPKVGSPGFSNVLARGIDEGSARLRPSARLVSGRMPRPGEDEAAVGARVRGRFEGLEPGGSIELRKGRSVKVVGVFEDGGDADESELWVGREALASAFGREATVSSLRIELASAEAFEPLREAIERDKRLGLSVERERAFLEQQSEGLSLFVRIVGGAVALLFSAGAVLGAGITMHAAVAQRQREIGTLRALGFSRASILAGFLGEALATALAGGAVGVALSLALARVKVSMINHASWSELVFTFAPSAKTAALSLSFALGMGALGGFLPALRAARVSPLAALRRR